MKEGRYKEAKFLFIDNINYSSSKNYLKIMDVYGTCSKEEYLETVRQISENDGLYVINYRINDLNLATINIFETIFNKKAVKEGYEFVKWVYDEFAINAKIEILILYFKHEFSIIEFKIEYNLDGVLLEGEYPNIYNMFEDVILPMLQKEGYELIS